MSNIRFKGKKITDLNRDELIVVAEEFFNLYKCYEGLYDDLYRDYSKIANHKNRLIKKLL